MLSDSRFWGGAHVPPHRPALDVGGQGRALIFSCALRLRGFQQLRIFAHGKVSLPACFFFAIFFVAAFYEERENLINFIVQAGLIALILNLTMMAISYYLAKTFASGVKQQKCIALECGLQNGTLAIFVSTQIFGTDILYAIPTGAYGLIMYITGFIFVFLIKNKS